MAINSQGMTYTSGKYVGDVSYKGIISLGGAPQYFAIFQNNSTATKTWS